MSLQDQIQDDLKTAMRAGETLRRDTLRMLIAALKLSLIHISEPTRPY